MFTDTSKVCIFGISGTGKSYLCRKIQEYFSNIIIFDTLYEYSEKNVFNNFSAFSDYIVSTQNENNLRVLYRFKIDDSKNDEIFNQAIRLLYYRGNCTIVIEEIQNFASVHKIPDYLKQASLTGRHKDISFITTTQRVAEIHKSILSQASDIFVGYTDSPTDLRTLKEFGFNIDDVLNLADRDFIWKKGRNFYYIDNDLNR